VMLPPAFIRTARWYDVAWPEYNCGRRLAFLAGPQDKVICHGEEGPQTLYYSDRQGWWVRREEWSREWVEKRRAEGAKWFATTYVGDFKASGDFGSWMFKTFKVVEE